MGEALVENARYVIDEDRRQCEAAPEIYFVRGSHSGAYAFLVLFLSVGGIAEPMGTIEAGPRNRWNAPDEAEVQGPDTG